ncbi:MULTISPECIES: hypothetical protein [unclassified Fibrobacter]|uniref:hypothetical protein n=1 Tax=unclassified Fibrobacter TaxID=2634177 RepID=UPI000D6C4825|nr:MULTISPECIES: hypothetical protein [unclassified Fibrobacter]PWJ69983.1 hypothetical protein BGX12_10463 [Fibrobacter sp. UWR4]PZW73154.1 hypothetical protein C8E88_100463 [Fibrobacter sp. UWR1]
MKFLYRHIFLLLPILSVMAVYFVYRMIQEDRRSIPKYEPKEVEDTWSAEEYMRHLNMRPFNNDEVHRLLLKRTRQKQGVYLESMPSIMDTIGLEIVNAYHVVLGDDYVPVISSGNDFPGHVRTSKHYMNAAFDFRIKDVPLKERHRLIEMVTDRIGNRCKVIWEKGEAEHLHVELLDPFIPKD